VVFKNTEFSVFTLAAKKSSLRPETTNCEQFNLNFVGNVPPEFACGVTQRGS
jgi:hypothetical protein